MARLAAMVRKSNLWALRRAREAAHHARVEVEGGASTFLERLFDGEAPARGPAIVGPALIDLAMAGGFPEALARRTERRRRTGRRPI